MNSIPNSEIIIIGGGAVGVGCAYALAKAGQTDVLVLERADDVGAVTTAQGAGLCGQVRDSAERIKLAMHSVATFRELQRSEVKPDWHEVGSLRQQVSEAQRLQQQIIQIADGNLTELVTAIRLGNWQRASELEIRMLLRLAA